tara:strand:+ start:611 stop:1099 length:489 start_codon:yes stop_codon:yes gene_type:complete
MKKLAVFLTVFFANSCSEIDFVYKDNINLVNPLYEKASINISGVDLKYINSYVPMFFGKNKENVFGLSINIEENKTKRSIEKNQTTSNLRYELKFSYTLKSNVKDCVTLKKEIVSYFSIIPKSDGYNYGTDASLEKKYELAIIDNFNEFISFLSRININNCT